MALAKISHHGAVNGVTGSCHELHIDNNINFVKRMRHKPKQIRLIHGDDGARQALQDKFKEAYPEIDVMMPDAINVKN